MKVVEQSWRCADQRSTRQALGFVDLRYEFGGFSGRMAGLYSKDYGRDRGGTIEAGQELKGVRGCSLDRSLLVGLLCSLDEDVNCSQWLFRMAVQGRRPLREETERSRRLLVASLCPACPCALCAADKADVSYCAKLHSK